MRRAPFIPESAHISVETVIWTTIAEDILESIARDLKGMNGPGTSHSRPVLTAHVMSRRRPH